MGILRTVSACAHAPRSRPWTFLLLLLAGIFTIIIISSSSSRLPEEDLVELRLASMRDQIRFLESVYRVRNEEVLHLQAKFKTPDPGSVITIRPELAALIKDISGTKAAAGLHPNNLQILNTPITYQLLPHLMDDPDSLRPAYHMTAGRMFTDVVIGITTVKRDKENYLMITLKQLLDGLKPEHLNSTMIVVFVGETDLDFVVKTAHNIETQFWEHVQKGLIEVLSPTASFYPNFDELTPTLGDSKKRHRWRTKANLDVMFLMAYVKTRGTYYLMLEDDVIPEKDYMTQIKQFTKEVSAKTPDWFFIEFCATGGIGKLFRSADLIRFITYVQLFFVNQPIDWLLESYLADKVCTFAKFSNDCGASKLEIRPKYKISLFKHVGLYSSLKGKIQHVDIPLYGKAPSFYSHTDNSPLDTITTDIHQVLDHSLERLYEGQDFFWGMTPKKDNFIEFWFKEPSFVDKYLFRSANVDHKQDKFRPSTLVEVKPKSNKNFEHVNSFDEFGLAEGAVDRKLGLLNAIRLHVLENSSNWVILSEVVLKLSTESS